MKKVAVTGAGGFIGSYLTRSLLHNGHPVVAIDNFMRGLPSRLHGLQGELECVDLDIRNEDQLAHALQGVQAVFHLAAINGTENFYKRPELVLDVGIRGALAVATSALQANVPDVIFASSAEVYQTPEVVPTPETVAMVIPDSLNPRYSYGGSKLVSELIAFNYLRDKVEKVQVFRPHNIYGPDMGWKHVIPQLIGRIDDAMRNGMKTVELQGDGSETRAFCHVDDVVNGILRMWRYGRSMEVYHIGNDQEVTILELAELIGRGMNCHVDFVSGTQVAGGTPRRCPDIGKMQAIGYRPQIDLTNGVMQTINWYRANPQPAMMNELL